MMLIKLDIILNVMCRLTPLLITTYLLWFAFFFGWDVALACTFHYVWVEEPEDLKKLFLPGPEGIQSF